MTIRDDNRRVVLLVTPLNAIAQLWTQAVPDDYSVVRKQSLPRADLYEGMLALIVLAAELIPDEPSNQVLSTIRARFHSDNLVLEDTNSGTAVTNLGGSNYKAGMRRVPGLITQLLAA